MGTAAENTERSVSGAVKGRAGDGPAPRPSVTSAAAILRSAEVAKPVLEAHHLAGVRKRSWGAVEPSNRPAPAHARGMQRWPSGQAEDAPRSAADASDVRRAPLWRASLARGSQRRCELRVRTDLAIRDRCAGRHHIALRLSSRTRRPAIPSCCETSRAPGLRRNAYRAPSADAGADRHRSWGAGG